MDKSLFADLLRFTLALLLLCAAVVDIRTRTIHNRLNLAIALMAPLYWYAMGDVGDVVAMRIAVALGVFVVLAIAFYLGAMGGGDVKLAAALALWFAPRNVVLMLIIMSLAGGLLTLIVVIEHRLRKNPGRPEIPYGVAIAFGGLWIIAQRFLNHFA